MTSPPARKGCTRITIRARWDQKKRIRAGRQEIKARDGMQMAMNEHGVTVRHPLHRITPLESHVVGCAFSFGWCRW